MPGLLRGVVRTAAIAGTATAVSNRVSRRQAGRWAEQDQQRAYEQQAYRQTQPPAAYAPAESPAAGVDMETKLAQLKDLAQLQEQGVLTAAEFETQKARILGS